MHGFLLDGESRAKAADRLSRKWGLFEYAIEPEQLFLLGERVWDDQRGLGRIISMPCLNPIQPRGDGPWYAVEWDRPGDPESERRLYLVSCTRIKLSAASELARRFRPGTSA